MGSKLMIDMRQKNICLVHICLNITSLKSCQSLCTKKASTGASVLKSTAATFSQSCPKVM